MIAHFRATALDPSLDSRFCEEALSTDGEGGRRVYAVIMIDMNVLPSSLSTRDKSIREKLRIELAGHTIIEELGLLHGTVRVDMVVVDENTRTMHGYELKSDLDTLQRLPEQMKIYNSTLDRVTIVVGRKHLHEAVKLVPSWWGVMLAKIQNENDEVSLMTLRIASDNPDDRDSFAIAQLLWRNEALAILEELEAAKGFRSKPREFIYRKLADEINQQDLCGRVRAQLTSREGWRSVLQPS